MVVRVGMCAYVRAYVVVCVRACVHVCVHLCVHVCVRMCVHECVCGRVCQSNDCVRAGVQIYTRTCVCTMQISNIHQIIIINKIQLRKKKIHSDFVGVDLRNKILF